MTKTELEKYLGEKVKITLFDGDIITGILHKTGESCFEDNPNLYIPRGYYVCVNDTYAGSHSCLFKISHIKNFKRGLI